MFTLSFRVKGSRFQIESYFFKQFYFCSTALNVPNNQKAPSLKCHNDKKFLRVAILGLPNVGKSTLINQLTRRSLCPTSSKVHTTLHKTEVVYTEDDTQIVFMDTPGLTTKHELKQYKLPDTFSEDPKISVKEADVVGIVQDVTNVYTRHKINNTILDYLKNKKEDTPVLLIFNKIDKIKDKTILLELSRQLVNQTDIKFDDIFMISSYFQDGVDDIRNYLLDSAKIKEWKYDQGHYTDQKPITTITEIVRAKLMDILPREMPYKIRIKIINFKPYSDGTKFIAVELTCVRKSHMHLLLKKNGHNIKLLKFLVEKEIRGAFRNNVEVQFLVLANKEVKPN